jgi:hypothetical protein
MHYEWTVLKREGYLGVALHFESGAAETNLKRLARVQAKAESIQAGVGCKFVAEPWGRKWAHAEFRLPFQGDFPSPALAAEAAGLMKTLIERTYPLIAQAD